MITFVDNLSIKMTKSLTPNISTAFQAIGVDSDANRTPDGIVLRGEKLRQSRGVVEPWSISDNSTTESEVIRRGEELQSSAHNTISHAPI
jgi:hypothetical protein